MHPSVVAVKQGTTLLPSIVKEERRHVQLDDFYDVFAFKVLVKTVPMSDCEVLRFVMRHLDTIVSTGIVIPAHCIDRA